jgi:paraquat-inducible protein B
MSKKANPRKIGAFVIGAIALVVVAVVVLGSGKLFKDTITVISWFDTSVGGLNPGAPVKYRGVQIGEVKEVLMQVFQAEARREFAMPVLYELDVQAVEQGAQRRLDPIFLDSLVDIGLRATLATESFVTGRKYIELDWHPDKPYHAENLPEVPYPEIPTIKTGLEEIQRELQELIAEIGSVKIDSLVLDLRDAVHGIDRLINSVPVQTLADSLQIAIHQVHQTFSAFESVAMSIDTVVVPLQVAVLEASKDAQDAAAQAELLVRDMRAQLAPGAPLSLQLQQTLAEIASAAASLRVLTDYLERNPSAILRGKPEDN